MIFVSRMVEIGYLNWIYILSGLKLASLLETTIQELTMNAYTTTPSAVQPQAESTIGRLFRAFCVELRRAIEIVGEAHNSGLRPH